MKKNVLLTLLLLGFAAFMSFSAKKQVLNNGLCSVDSAQTSKKFSDRIYDSLQLEELGLSKQVFNLAMQGHDELERTARLKKSNILSVVDFSMPSTAKRLFVIDLAACQLLFNTYVAHGRNSGENIASSFSNNAESFKSSLGFYSTAAIYSGKHGYSLQLNGLEQGFNDKAMSRGIVIHAADYVSETVAKTQGRLGRSLGCPAVPESLHKPIIAAIANGSCLFIYANDANYLKHSGLLHTVKVA